MSFLSQFDSASTSHPEPAAGETTLTTSSSSGSLPSTSTASTGPVSYGSLSRRRARLEDSDDEDNVDNVANEIMRKRRKVFAHRICPKYGLPADTLEGFSELSTSEMLIELMAQTMYHIEQTVGNQTSDYLGSTDFKRAFQKDLTGCMLSPNLKSYVTTTIADITELVRINHDTFRILKSTIADPDKWTTVLRLIGKLLSRVRGAIKTKLDQSLPGVVIRGRVRPDATGIVDLTKKVCALAPHIEIEAEHYPRVAFLRLCLVAFNKTRESTPAPPSTSRAPSATPRASSLTPHTSSSTPHAPSLTPHTPSSTPRAPPDDDPRDDAQDEEGNGDDSDDLCDSFWLYVDKSLAKIHQDAKMATSSQLAYLQEVNKTFSGCLLKDREMFASTKGVPRSYNAPTTLQQLAAAYYAANN